MDDVYAAIGDLEAAWRPLSEAEYMRADKLLEYASARVRNRVPGIDDALAIGTVDAILVEATVVTMVKRAMLSPGGEEGVAREDQAAGPFSQGVTYANPMGNLYITDQEIRDLGGSPATGRARTMRLTGGYC